MKKLLLLSCLLVLFLVPVIKYYRINYTSGVNHPFLESISYSIKNNFVMDVLLELGANFRILPMTVSKISSVGYANGTVYLSFFNNMLPGFLKIPSNYGTLSKWLLNTNDYQTNGFSIWAEAYLNFGSLGFVATFVIGVVLGILFGANPSNQNPVSFYVTGSSLFFFGDVVRRAFSEFGYNFMYDIILPSLIVCVLIYLCRPHYSAPLVNNGTINYKRNVDKSF